MAEKKRGRFSRIAATGAIAAALAVSNPQNTHAKTTGGSYRPNPPAPMKINPIPFHSPLHPLNPMNPMSPLRHKDNTNSYSTNTTNQSTNTVPNWKSLSLDEKLREIKKDELEKQRRLEKARKVRRVGKELLGVGALGVGGYLAARGINRKRKTVRRR